MGNDRANDLGKLNDLLFEELARLNTVDAGDEDAVKAEVSRAKAIQGIAGQVTDDVALAPGRGRRRDIELAGEVPAFLREDRALAARLDARERARRSRVASLLDSRRIEHVTVTSDAVMMDQIAELLARQRLASSRKRR